MMLAGCCEMKKSKRNLVKFPYNSRAQFFLLKFLFSPYIKHNDFGKRARVFSHNFSISSREFFTVNSIIRRCRVICLFLGYTRI